MRQLHLRLSDVVINADEQSFSNVNTGPLGNLELSAIVQGLHRAMLLNNLNL